MASPYPPPIQAIINSGQVPKIKATRADLNLDYDIANDILRRIMDLVYKKAVREVIDAPVNYEHSLTVEQIESIHQNMYQYIGAAKDIPLDVIMGLRDPYEEGKGVMQKHLINALFGSMDQSDRISTFEGIIGIEHPENLRIRFGKFDRGSQLHAIFIENMYIVPNAPSDAVQYHMTIGPVIELEGLAQGYHMTNYFYQDPYGPQRTFYRNNGAVLADKAASRAELDRRQKVSNSIDRALAKSKEPLTPSRKRAMRIQEVLQEKPTKRAATEAETAGAAAAPVEEASRFDPKTTVIPSRYTLSDKPVVVNGSLGVTVTDKSGNIVHVFQLGNLTHYGLGSYTADVLNEDNVHIRSSKGRKFTIRFDDADLPKRFYALLSGAREVSCLATSGGASSASGGGGGGSAESAICMTPQGEPLPVYLMRENLSRTPLGDTLYNLLIAYFSNIMPSSPKKLNIDSALFQVADVMSNPQYALELILSPELVKIMSILTRYNLNARFNPIKERLLAIYDNSPENEDVYPKIKAVGKAYPPIPIEDLDLVERTTYVTDPAVHYRPPLYYLTNLIPDIDRVEQLLKIKHLSGAESARRTLELRRVLADIHAAAISTPDNHPSIGQFKKEMIDTTLVGKQYTKTYGPFKGKQTGGFRKNNIRRTRRLRGRRRPTRKAN